jgi:protein transport protein SEC31
MHVAVAFPRPLSPVFHTSDLRVVSIQSKERKPTLPKLEYYSYGDQVYLRGMVGSIPRTAVPIWSPSSLPSSTPLLATGTVSGALDASFSSDSLLELWDPFAPSPDSAFEGVETELAPVASLGVGSRFNRLAWGYVKSPERPKGVISAGLENGEIGLWDPQVMLSQSEDEAAE